MSRLLALCTLCFFAAWQSVPPAAEPAFFADDPIGVFPEPADASTIRPRRTSQGFDFVENSFLRSGERENRRAANVNTIDEVPDSSWFTNRIGVKPLTLEEIRRGPDQAGPASGPWTVLVGDAGGTTPGFRIRDTAGQVFFIKLDQPRNPELTTGAEAVSTKIFHALGYNVPENYIVAFDRNTLDITGAQLTNADGRRRPMTARDLDDLLDKAARTHDGTYRAIASKAVAGTILGPFRYYGTVPDDPNDIVLHEHRRELRGMRVFAAWVNHVDSRGINSLDTLIDVGARKLVRHYLIDFGSTLGSAAITVKSRRSGHGYLWDVGDSIRTVATFGLFVPSWAFIPYPMELPAVGRFEADHFDPESWVPHYPNPAFLNARADDTFWAARRVMAFSDEAIRTVVEAGDYSDPRATDYIAQVLIERRDKIGQVWLTNINPLVDFQIDTAGTMQFDNAAVSAGVADAAREYRIQWGRFDNPSQTTTAEGGPVVVQTSSVAVPEALLRGSGPFIRAEISTTHDKYPAWKRPVRVTFRREGTGWKTVGLDRIGEP